VPVNGNGGRYSSVTGGAGVLAYRDARGQAEGERDGHWELAPAGGFAVDEQLGDAGRSFAFPRLRLPSGFELEAEDVFAGRDFDLGDDLELLLGNVVVGVGVAQPVALDEEGESAVDPALRHEHALGTTTPLPTTGSHC
jgi:hypothetical protein